jgi:hypothetical protein
VLGSAWAGWLASATTAAALTQPLLLLQEEETTLSANPTSQHV